MPDAINQKLGLDATSAISSITSLDASIDKLNASMMASNKQMGATASASAKMSTSFHSVSTSIGAAGTSVTNFKNTVAKTSNTSKKNIDGISNSMSKLEKNASMMAKILQVQLFIRGFNLITQGFKDAVAEALEFNKAIGEISTISGSALGGLSQISTSVRELANELGRPVAEVAEAEYQTLSNQVVKAGESFNFLTDAHKLALATNSSLVDSVQALSSSLNSYRDENLSASHASDILFKSVELGRLRLSEVSNTLGKFLPLASEMGISMEEASAAFVTMTQAGVKANTAIVYMRALMTSMLKPSKTMGEVLQSLGADTFPQLVEQSGGLSNALERIMSYAKEAGIGIEQLTPNTRALNAILTITGDNAERFSNVLKGIEDSAGAADLAASKMESTDYRKLVSSVNELKNSFVTLGEAAVKSLANFAPAIEWAASNVTALAGGVVTASTIILGQFSILTAKALGLQFTLAGLKTAFATVWPIAAAVAAGAAIGYLISKVTEYKNSSIKAIDDIDKKANEQIKTAEYVAERVAEKYKKKFKELKTNGIDAFGEISDASKQLIKSITTSTKAMANIFGKDVQNAIGKAKSQLKQIEDSIYEATKAQEAFADIYKDGSTEALKLEKELRKSRSDNERGQLLQRKSTEALSEAYKKYHDIIRGRTPASEAAIDALNEKFKEAAKLQGEAADYYGEGSREFEYAKDKEIAIMEKRDAVARKGEALLKKLVAQEKSYLQQQVEDAQLLIEKFELISQKKAEIYKAKGPILSSSDQKEVDSLNKQLSDTSKKVKNLFAGSRLTKMLGVKDFGNDLVEAISKADERFSIFIKNAQVQLNKIRSEKVSTDLEFNPLTTGDVEEFKKVRDILTSEVDPQTGLVKALNYLSKRLPEVDKQLRVTKEKLDALFGSKGDLVKEGKSAFKKLSDLSGELTAAGEQAQRAFIKGFKEELKKNPDANIGKYFSKNFNGDATTVGNYGSLLGQQLLNGIDKAISKGDVTQANKLFESYISLVEGLKNKIGETFIFQGPLKSIKATEHQVVLLKQRLEEIPPLEFKGDVEELKTTKATLEEISTQIENTIRRQVKANETRKSVEDELKNKVDSTNKARENGVKTLERSKELTEKTSKATEELEKAASNTKTEVSNVRDGLNKILETNKGIKSSFEVLPKDVSNLGTVLYNIQDPIENIESGFGGISANINNVSTSAKSLFSGFSAASVNLQTLMTSLTGMQSLISPIGTLAGNLSVDFSTILTTLTMLNTSLNGTSQSMIQMANSASNISSNIDLNKLEKFADKLKEAAEYTDIGIEVDYSKLEETLTILNSVSDTSEQIINNFSEWAAPLEDVKTAIDEARESTRELDISVGGAEHSMNSFKTSCDKARQSVNRIDDGIPALIQGINRAISAMVKLKLAADSAARSASAASRAAAGAGVGNSGKFITRANGGVGTDTISALLSPGEFVMNSKQTRQFYSQLVAMNAGAYNGGGGTTNNISNTSDVTININESSNPGQTAREIATMLNRGTNRGIIKLNN